MGCVEVSVRHPPAFRIWETVKDEPLVRDLEREPLELGVLVLTDGGDLVLRVVPVDQVLDDHEGFPVVCVLG